MRSYHPRWLAILAGFLLLEFSAVPVTAHSQDPTAIVTVAGTDRDLGETPILVAVDGKKLTPGRCLLKAPGTDPARPGLIFRDGDQTFLGFVLDQVPARSTVEFALEPDPTPGTEARGVTLVTEGKRIKVELDGKLWTNYVPDDGPKPYFDPLMGPSDEPLTRAWPMRDVAGEPHDHPHHRSLWFAHYDINKANTWDENPGHGSIRETSRPTMIGGGPIGVIRTEDDWLDRTGQKVCADERVVTFYATQKARVFDFVVTLKATSGPIRIGDNKDGVFGIRLAAPMAVTAHQGGQILNARGQKDKAAWGQPAEWVDYTGPVAGATMGVAILNQPESFRFPTTWHVRDYGLFAANPFGWHDFGQPRSGDYEVPAGESIRLAYRVILHAGTTEAADIAGRFAGYAHPPQVTVR